MDKFVTRDVYLAATLLAYGEKISDIDKKDTNHQTFVFDGDCRRLSRLQNEYLNKKLHVEVLAYRDCLIRLKNIIHANKF